jgi:hypothetical protein
MAIDLLSKLYVNIAADLKRIGRKAVNWINLAQVGVQWRVVTNTVP